MSTRGAAAVFALLAVACARPAARPELRFPGRPHPVIVFDVDTLRADHLGVYGYGRRSSPNIDRFAREAVVFEWAFSQAPNTAPSQTSILTGLYPSTHGVIAPGERVPEDVDTLAELFARAGFTTAAFVDGGFMRAGFGFGQGFATYDDSGREGLAVSGPRVMDWLEAHHADNFLLLIHTYDVHGPYDAPEPHKSAMLAGLPPPEREVRASAQFLERVRRSSHTLRPLRLAPRQLAWIEGLYDGGIHYVDHWFGTLVRRLQTLGLLDRATVVVLSDHGEEFQEHGSLLHEKLYATVTRVPLMIRFPGGRGARRITSTVEVMDVMPTLLEACGLPVPPAVQAASLLPFLDPGRRVPPRLAFSESPFFGEQRAVTANDLRIVVSRAGGNSEAYLYRDDPREQRDLAAAQRARLEGLALALGEWERRVRMAARPGRAGSSALDDETREELRALGYLQ